MVFPTARSEKRVLVPVTGGSCGVLGQKVLLRSDYKQIPTECE